MVARMIADSNGPTAAPLTDPMRMHDEEAPCFPSLLKVVVIQSQNALNDKVAQYVLLGLAQVIPALTEPQRETYPHIGALLLALPLILFAPMAGWLSDRFSKRSILFWCSVAQWGGMAAISLCFYFNWFWMATFFFFILATQATLLGPAKGGIVKELVGEKHLTWANSWVQATGLVAIVAGPWFGGALFKWMVPLFPGEAHLAAFWPSFILAIAATVPVLLAMRVKKTPAHSDEPARWSLLWEHFFHLKDLLRVRTLRLTAFGISYFWFAATLLALLLVQVAQVITPDRAAQAALSGFLLAWVGLGIAAGSVIVGLVSTNRIELGLIPLGGLGMAIGSIAVALPWVELGGVVFCGLMFVIGMSSAVFLVPLNAYLQDLVEPAKRGRQLAASGLLDSLGMFFGIIVQYVWWAMGLSGGNGAKLQFILLAVLCLATAVYVVRIIPQNFLRFVLLAMVKLIYRVRVVHGERIPATGGALLIANHVSFIDAFIVSAACERKVRFIASDQFHKMRFIGPFLNLFDVVPVSPTRAKDAIMVVAEAVEAGDLVCIFPEGQITRSGIFNEIRKGFELIARRSKCPVVTVHLDDLWGSIASFERGKFFKKLPKRYAYQVSVSFGHPEPPETATADWARRQFRELGREAMGVRGELKSRLEVAALAELCRQPWRQAAHGKHDVSRAMMLAQAWTLARVWPDAIRSDRVAILCTGYHALVANLALRLSGFTPVNVSLELHGDLAALAAHLHRENIHAVVNGEVPDQTHGLEWINLDSQLNGMDALRLGMRMVSVYLLPKSFQAWRLGRKRRHVTLQREAVGWLSRNRLGEVKFQGLSHMDVLIQSEQLSSMDALRDGESIYSAEGFASVEGTVMGLWHPLLQGGSIVVLEDWKAEADLFLGNGALAEELAAQKPSKTQKPRAFYCFKNDAAIPESLVMKLEKRWKLRVCPSFVATEQGRILALSLPDAVIATRTSEPQSGTKLGASGRLLPGYSTTLTDGKLEFQSPDGLDFEAEVDCVDGEDFLFPKDIPAFNR